MATYSSRLAVARVYIRQQQCSSVKLLSWCGVYLGYSIPLPWCTKVACGVRSTVSYSSLSCDLSDHGPGVGGEPWRVQWRAFIFWSLLMFSVWKLASSLVRTTCFGQLYQVTQKIDLLLWSNCKRLRESYTEHVSRCSIKSLRDNVIGQFPLEIESVRAGQPTEIIVLRDEWRMDFFTRHSLTLLIAHALRVVSAHKLRGIGIYDAR